MRFPRIHRIRWDKPAREADKLARLEHMLAPFSHSWTRSALSRVDFDGFGRLSRADLSDARGDGWLVHVMRVWLVLGASMGSIVGRGGALGSGFWRCRDRGGG